MTRPANTMRGEDQLIVDGECYILRPTFSALVAAEEELGSLFALVERASEGALTAKEISTLLWHCLPTDTRPTRETVGAAILDQGLVKATTPVRSILAQVLQGRA